MLDNLTMKTFSLTACGAHQWQCDYGNCVPLIKRCNGNIDCPEDMSDERNCPSKFNGMFLELFEMFAIREVFVN